MFSSWWSGEKSPDGEGGDSAAPDPSDDVATAAKESGKAALDGLWNVVSKVATTVTDNVPGILADFSAEEEKFKRQKRHRHTDAAVPPWVGYNEEEIMRTQILALSTDKRNFLRNPPAGVQFHFDFAVSFPVANAILEEDPMLEKMRFELVPKQVTEEIFWRNYFYRVSLIKQSSQLSTLATQQNAELSEALAEDAAAAAGASSGSHSDLTSVSPAAEASSSGSDVGAAADVAEHEEPEENAAAEFISDDFVADAADGAQDEGEKELHQELKDLGMDDLEEIGDLPEGDEVNDAEWEKEIQAMLDMEEPTTT
ncbi:synapse-associated protein 1-like [Sycon ciliatum]|uniref:synapse-associated protein 1-like n=1 Tax=Sycon ciliatum TaxID=27933 RepID=UPI0031F6524E